MAELGNQRLERRAQHSGCFDGQRSEVVRLTQGSVPMSLPLLGTAGCGAGADGALKQVSDAERVTGIVCATSLFTPFMLSLVKS